MRKVIEISENATNGDMIKAMFNPYKICEYKFIVLVYITEKDYWESEYAMECSTGWWNASYKVESEEV